MAEVEDGRVLRARSRSVDGRWEVRADKDWKALQPGLVIRARLEREVLAEARGKEQEFFGRMDQALEQGSPRSLALYPLAIPMIAGPAFLEALITGTGAAVLSYLVTMTVRRLRSTRG